MPASFCVSCQEIVLVEYKTERKGDKITTTLTCRKCQRVLVVTEELFVGWVARMTGLKLNK